MSSGETAISVPALITAQSTPDSGAPKIGCQDAVRRQARDHWAQLQSLVAAMQRQCDVSLALQPTLLVPRGFAMPDQK